MGDITVINALIQKTEDSNAKKALDNAIIALKKQEPMKPEIFDSHWHRCPVCKVYSGGLRAPYCHSCGQALYWE